MIKAFLLAALLHSMPGAFAAVPGTPIQIHVMTALEIQEAFQDHNPDDERRVGGWAFFAEDLSWCHIYVPPLTWGTLGIWQHELRHCTEGAFHQ